MNIVDNLENASQQFLDNSGLTVQQRLEMKRANHFKKGEKEDMKLFQKKKKEFDADRKNAYEITNLYIQRKYSAWRRTFNQSDLFLLRNLVDLEKHIFTYLELFKNHEEPAEKIDFSSFILPRINSVEKLFIKRFQQYRTYEKDVREVYFKDMQLIAYDLISFIQKEIEHLIKGLEKGKYYFEENRALLTISSENAKLRKTDKISKSATVIDKTSKLNKPETGKIIDHEVREQEAFRDELRSSIQTPQQANRRKAQLDSEATERMIKNAHFKR